MAKTQWDLICAAFRCGLNLVIWPTFTHSHLILLLMRHSYTAGSGQVSESSRESQIHMHVFIRPSHVHVILNHKSYSLLYQAVSEDKFSSWGTKLHFLTDLCVMQYVHVNRWDPVFRCSDKSAGLFKQENEFIKIFVVFMHRRYSLPFLKPAVVKRFFTPTERE